MDFIFKLYAHENCSGYKISAKSEKLQYFALFAILGSKLQTFQKWTSFSNYMHKNCSGCKISAKSEKLQYFALLVSKLQTFQNHKMFIEQNRFANCKYKNGSGCKISAKSEKLQYLPFLPFWGQNYKLFKNGLHFQILQHKNCSRVQNFSQIRETTIFCPFGVKITNFSKMIKCSQNRIDLQIVNTKTVLGAKFQPNQRNYNMLPFLPFQGSKLQNVQKWTSFSNSMQTKTVPGTKFQPNQRNYNILTFWGQNQKLFKNHKMFIEQNRFANCKYKNGSGCKISAKSEKLQYVALFAILGVKITNFSKMDLIFKFYATLKLFSGTKFQPNQRNYNILPFLPFGVKITNFSKMIKCSQNRIDLQIVNTKTVLGAKFQSKSE